MKICFSLLPHLLSSDLLKSREMIPRIKKTERGKNKKALASITIKKLINLFLPNLKKIYFVCKGPELLFVEKNA